jgi:hypothetical protein
VSGKGVGDPDGLWAHLIYTAYPRRAENELPPDRRYALDALFRGDHTASRPIVDHARAREA